MVFNNDNFPQSGSHVNHEQLRLDFGELFPQKLSWSSDKARKPYCDELAVILTFQTKNGRLFYIRLDPDKVFRPGWDMGDDGKRLGGGAKILKTYRLAHLCGMVAEYCPRKIKIWRFS